MSILSWIEKDSQKSSQKSLEEGGLWTRCYQCGAVLYIKHLKENHHVCFACHSHLQMTSRERLHSLIDPGTWQPFDETLSSIDPLNFYDQKSYISRLKDAQNQTGLQDSVLTGTGLLDGIPIALGIMDFNFMGGSMGSVVGEKLTRLIEYATREGLMLIIVCASGGARMHEGILSLMQMAKISAALNVYQNTAHLMYIAVLTSPTTGGVTASFAMLGDLILAEPNALIGFAGRRVIEQTLQEKLPENFQTAEYLLEHGLLDLIISREFLKPALYEILSFYKDAPLKTRGRIPKKFFQSLNLLTEEKIRRQFNKKIPLNCPTNITTNTEKTIPDLNFSKNLFNKFNSMNWTANSVNWIANSQNLHEKKLATNEDISGKIQKNLSTNVNSQINLYVNEIFSQKHKKLSKFNKKIFQSFNQFYNF
uniref:Acetyl-coenzyme A carboxylase carboxyl transferase subunit beta, chloroplastic n=1 Tax=Pseudochlorodesmis sp. HV01306a TaxID=2358488 RepID=A0A386AXZ8_9CHLO|nr:acetyl-CoA carboxylase, carboxyl transferase subunit beta [Pseudochlorodesmis sp. HV01306a]